MLSYHTKLDQEESDADQPPISYMDSTNWGTATGTKDHASEKLRLVVGGGPPEPVGDPEQDRWESSGRSQVVEYRQTHGTVLE